MSFSRVRGGFFLAASLQMALFFGLVSGGALSASAELTAVFEMERETMGTPAGTTSIAMHTFDGDACYAYDAGGEAWSADVRVTSPSAGYEDPLGGGASGSGNVWFAASERRGFAMYGIDASLFRNMRLGFGYRKERVAANMDFVVEFSVDGGASWGDVPVSGLPGGGASTGWYYVSDVVLPEGADRASSLSLRWVKRGDIPGRLDDVVLLGEQQSPGPFPVLRIESPAEKRAEAGPADEQVSVAGISEHAQGVISWTNLLTGLGGEVAAEDAWSADGIGLRAGTNLVVFRATNSAAGRSAMAGDAASDYGEVWSAGDNEGAGFGPWRVVTADEDTGMLLDASTQGGAGMNIDTEGVSWCLYGGAGAWITVEREFVTGELGVGEGLEAELAFNYLDGERGLTLTDRWGEEVFYFSAGRPAGVDRFDFNGTVLDWVNAGDGYNYVFRVVRIAVGQGRFELERSDGLAHREVFAWTEAPARIRFFSGENAWEGGHPAERAEARFYLNRLRRLGQGAMDQVTFVKAPREPVVGVAPASLAVTNVPGGMTERILMVGNEPEGLGSLDFSLYSRETGRRALEQAARGVRAPAAERDFSRADPRGVFEEGSMLVRFAPSLRRADRSDILRRSGGSGARIERTFEVVPGLALVRLDRRTGIEQALVAFNAEPDVIYAEPNYIQRIATEPNDPRFDELWGLHNTGQTGGTPGADIGALEAWSFDTGSREVVVAVIDTGVDYGHEDLADNMWINPRGGPDLHGYNFLGNSPDPMDDHGHGTHCAGTIGAVGNNEIGVVGVNWEVSIMALKFLGADGSGHTADAISCIEYAIGNGAHVLNNSWGGGGYSQALKDAIDAAGAANILFVASAGNDGRDNDQTPHYPASYDSENVLSVMATDHHDKKSWFSNYGEESVHLGAPGSAILSCEVRGGYVSWQGTSMAAPHVAGAAALLLSYAPGLEAGTIRRILCETVDVTEPALACVSGGRLNVGRAMGQVEVDWISLAPDTATGVAAGSSVEVSVRLDAGNLEAGVYEGEVWVFSNDPERPRVAVPCVMTVMGDALGVSPPEGFEAEGLLGGPFGPEEKVYVLTNRGTEEVSWSVAHTSDWLAVSSAGGVIEAGGHVSVTARVAGAAVSLGAGVHEDRLVFEHVQTGARFGRTARIDVGRLPETLVHWFPLDEDPGWSTEGLWAFGEPQPEGGNPASGYTGTNVYGYNLAGKYENNMPVRYLTTTALDCSHFDALRLEFRRWLGIEHGMYDEASIEVSGDGSDWFEVWRHTGPTFQETAWHLVSYDLPDELAGTESLFVRWGMGPTDSKVAFSGWNIDDIAIYGSSTDTLGVSPAEGWEATGLEQGPFSPTSQVYRLVNRSGEPMVWQAHMEADWLGATPSGGTLAPAESVLVTVWIGAAAGDLPPGVHEAVARFENGSNGINHRRLVRLDVGPIPGSIEVLDSIAPEDDRLMPFGDVVVGIGRVEHITVSNTDAVHDLLIRDISFDFYLEDFESGEATGWVPTDESHWRVEEGEYRAGTPHSKRMISTYKGGRWDDVTAEISCRREGNAGPAAALLLRASDDFDTDVGSAYLFQIATTGGFSIWKQIDGEFSWLHSWDDSPAIGTGQNILRAQAVGNELSFFVNGTLVWSGTDDSLAEGRVGVSGYSDGSTVHYFDYVMAGEVLPDMTEAAGMDAAGERPAVELGSDPRMTLPVPGRGVGPLVLKTRAARPFEASMSGFRLTNGPASFPVLLGPGASLTFDVVFEPEATVETQAAVSIKSNDPDEPRVLVELAGRGIPDFLEVSPLGVFESSGHPGGPFTPGEQAFEVSNNGDEAIGWSVGHTQAWLEVSSAGGVLEAGATQQVTVSVLDGLVPDKVGFHEDVLVFSNTMTGLSQQRKARVEVYTSPLITIAPDQFVVTNVPGRVSVRELVVGNAAEADASLDVSLRTRELERPAARRAAGVGLPPESRDFSRVDPQGEFAEDTLLVRFRPGLPDQRQAEVVADAVAGASIERAYQVVPGLRLIRLAEGTHFTGALAALNRQADVLYAEPNYIQRISAEPNDPRFDELWGLHNTGQTGGTPGADISALEAWSYGTGSRQVVVAVIDTGVDYTHEDLADNMWINPRGGPDLHGYDFVNDRPDPMDDHGHGTHCAGTIGAVGNNEIGVAGVNWEVSIMALKFLDAGGSGDTADAISCIEYAIGNGAHVLNNSWGGGAYSQALKDAIDAAGAADILFVASAGNTNSDNDSDPRYPASYDCENIVSVMSTDHHDERSWFSCYGAESVHLGAPGSAILSCLAGGGYVSWSGTSMAAPHVAGAAALMLAHAPYLTPPEIRELLIRTADVTDPPLVCVAEGRLNLARVMSEVRANWILLGTTSLSHVAAGSSEEVTVHFDAGALRAGRYEGEIVLTSNDRYTPEAYVSCVMVVLDDPLEVYPMEGFTLTGMMGGPFEPEEKVYVLTNRGATAVSWSVAHTSDWLEVSSAGGVLEAGGHVVLTTRVTEASVFLEAGLHEDRLLFEHEETGARHTRGARLHVSPPPATLVHWFPLDEDPGWSTEGLWAFGEPQPVGGNPDSGHTGTNVYGYNLEGEYENNMHVRYLTTTALDCAGYESLQLSFWRWLGIESARWDHASIQGSADGTNWVDIWTHTGDTFQDMSWKPMNYNMPDELADTQTLFVRWGMGPTDSSITYCGWNIDDVGIYGSPMDRLVISPGEGLVAAGYQGGPFTPTSQVYRMVNTSGDELAWDAVSHDAWLTVEPAGGLLAAGASTEVTIHLNEEAREKPWGLYTGRVVFSNETSGFAQGRLATLLVNEIPGRIEVTDSIPPEDDHAMPFGGVLTGDSRTGLVTVRNTDDVRDLLISDIGFGEYYEDFASGEARGWEGVPTSAWAVVNGEYRARSSVMPLFMTSLQTTRIWQDYAATIHVRREGGFEGATTLGIRCSEDFDMEALTGEGYVVGVTGEAEFWVIAVEDDSYRWLQNWTYSPLLNTGSRGNEIAFSVQGAQLAVYFNGELAWSGGDFALRSSGHVSVGGFSGVFTPNEHVFDHVHVGAPLAGSRVGDEQAWYNARGVKSDDIRRRPDGFEATPFAPAEHDKPRPGDRLLRTDPVAGAFSLANLPPLPLRMGPGESFSFDVTFQPLYPTRELEQLLLTSNDESDPVIELALSGRGAEDMLVVDPTDDFETGGRPGGPFAPAETTYTLFNAGAESLVWQMGLEVDWLVATPTGGVLATGAYEHVTLSVVAEAVPTGVGFHEAWASFSNATTATAHERLVRAEVYTNASLTLSPLSFAVTNLPGGHSAGILTVANAPSADAPLRVQLRSRKTRTESAEHIASGVGLPPPDRDFTQPDPRGDYDASTLLVRFDPGQVSVQGGAQSIRQTVGAEVVRTYRTVPGLVMVRLAETTTLGQALEELNRLPEVLYAEPNYIQRISAEPNDPRFHELWGLHNTGQTGGTPGADIGALEAWSFDTGSREVVVAVIDTGVDYTHEDLADNMWINPRGGPDLHGYDFVNDRPDPMDDHGHGTHCAGTIGAVGNNETGVAGVNWEVSIMALKFLDAGGSGQTADAISCIEYAIENGAHVLNNSWGGGGYSQALKDAIDAAGAANILFVASAGNNATDNDQAPHYPANYDSGNIVSVMATDHHDRRSGFSNYGAESVHLGAPGSDILSCQAGGGYVSWNGTSMAAPHVAGAAALMLSHAPDLTVMEIKEFLLGTVDVTDPPLVCVSGGRMNLARAMGELGVSWIDFEVDLIEQIEPGESVELEVAFAAGNLAAGDYAGEIVVLSNDRHNRETRIPCSMLVLEDPLDVSPAEGVLSTGVLGGPFTPASFVYVLTNTSEQVVAWHILHGADWLELEPDTGDLAPGDHATVTGRISHAASFLNEGSYSETLTFQNNASGARYQRTVQLDVTLPTPTRLHFFPLDEDPGWHTEGEWAFGQPQPVGGNPASGYTGNYVYGYNLEGPYANNMPVYHLTTRAIDCSGYEGLELVFRRWLGVENAAYDQAGIQASTDGVHWRDVWIHSGSTIQDTAWQKMRHPLPRETDGADTLYLRWSMGPTDESVTYCGWNIDDIEIHGVAMDALRILPADDFVATGREGGPFAPTSLVYRLRSASESVIPWEAREESGWFTVEPSQGELAPGEAVDVTVMLLAATDELGHGEYATEVTFVNTQTQFEQRRGATLLVEEIPGSCEVTDSIPPEDDHAMPFGEVYIGLAQREQVHVRNTHTERDLLLTGVRFGDYVEDFESGEARGWAGMPPESWSVHEGTYRALSESTVFMRSLYEERTWFNSAASVVARRLGDPHSVSMLGVRCSPDMDLNTMQGQGYVAGHTGDGHFFVIVLEEGDFDWLQFWTPSPLLNTDNTANEITLSIEGSILRLFLNGELAWTASHEGITEPGHVSLGGYTESDQITTHLFDEVRVTPPVAGEVVGGKQAWLNEQATPSESFLRPPVPAQTPARSQPGSRQLEGAGDSLVRHDHTAGAFSFDHLPAFPHRLAPGNTVTFDVVFAPVHTNEQLITALIESNDDTHPTIELALSGSGLPDTLVIEPADPFELSGHAGGPFTPAEKAYTLHNAGTTALDWNAEPQVDWLAVTPASGLLDAGATGTVYVTANALAEDLQEGEHSGLFTFHNHQTEVAYERLAILTVYTSPRIQVAPGSLSAAPVRGGTVRHTLTVSNAPHADGPLSFRVRTRETTGRSSVDRSRTAERPPPPRTRLHKTRPAWRVRGNHPAGPLQPGPAQNRTRRHPGTSSSRRLHRPGIPGRSGTGLDPPGRGDRLP